VTSTVTLESGAAFTLEATADVASAINALEQQAPKVHTKLKRYMVTMAQIGRCSTGTKPLQGNSADGLFEFIADNIRVLFFYHPSTRKVIICAHYFEKDGEKTHLGHIASAQRLRTIFQRRK